MALFVLAPAAAKAGVVAPEVRFAASVWLGSGVVMIVVAIGAMHMRLRWFWLCFGHVMNSEYALKVDII